MTTFGWERMPALLAEPNLMEMVREFWWELSPKHKTLPLDPAWDDMVELEKIGRFKVWAGRTGEGTLAGFWTFHVFNHMNYRTVKFATDGPYYLAPAYRDTDARLGWRMFITARAALKEEGVKLMAWHDNLIKSAAPFFLRVGAKPVSVMYWDEL